MNSKDLQLEILLSASLYLLLRLYYSPKYLYEALSRNALHISDHLFAYCLTFEDRSLNGVALLSQNQERRPSLYSRSV